MWGRGAELTLSLSCPAPYPGLEHQYRPERILPVPPTGLVLVETLAHIGDVEQPAGLERIVVDAGEIVGDGPSGLQLVQAPCETNRAGAVC